MLRKLIFGLLACLALEVKASPGDTVYVKTFDNYHMGSYGNHFKKALMPPASRKNQRIWMKYTIGCTANGQCEWDYTLKLMLREHTGKLDSLLKQAPSFKVIGGTAKDTLVRFSYDTTYVNVFNQTSKQTDSLPGNPIYIARFGDTANPLVCTDTLIVWPALYYRYAFDTTGQKSDSVFVPAQDTMQVTYTGYYSLFEVMRDWEMGRMITPYAKSFPKTFRYEYLYDVTDFASLLHDSVELRMVYEGYTFGFTSTLEFFFIEGIPDREAFQLEQIYNAYYTYGNASNPIEKNLSSKKFTVPQDAVNTKLRILITGHGGEQNENCAEFCAKYYYLRLNKKLIASQLVWKDDCGSNAIINQPGTWIYDRSNWCPGEKIRVYEYNLDVAPGSTDSIDMDMDPFVANGGAGYGIAAYLVYYKANQYTLDAGIEEILAPTTDFWQSRFNPVCDNGKMVLKNRGTQTITSVKFSYRIGDAQITQGSWIGSLAFGNTAEVSLPWLNWPSDHSKNTFTVWLTEVNGQSVTNDENAYNNTLTSHVSVPDAVPSYFIIETLTNTKPEENSYQIKDASGKVIFSKTFTKASFMHRDTFNLNLGCYSLELTDKGKNGLSFWANSAGNGSFRIRSGVTPVNFLKTFNPDFGNFVRYNFTVMYKVGIDESALERLQIFPSPASDLIHIEGYATVERVELLEFNGKVVNTISGWSGEPIDIRNINPGIYLLKLTGIHGEVRVVKIPIVH